ncbi:hypothetical protein [Kitasatospora sp. NPDC004272]
MSGRRTEGPGATGATGRTDFASASLARHLLRGAVGFGAVAAGFALLPGCGPVALLLVPVGLFALRGCPMCWTVGLLQTLSRGRWRRDCADGRCSLAARAPGR